MTSTRHTWWIWGARPVSAAIFTAMCTAAFGWWGLLAGLPLAVILVHLALRAWRTGRRPVACEIDRLQDQFWAAESAELAHDPHLENITASFVVRRQRRVRRR